MAAPVVIDYTPAATQTAGIGRLVRDHVAALLLHDRETAYALMFPSSAPVRPVPQAANVRHLRLPFAPKWQHRIWHRLRLPLPVDVFTGQMRLFHATDFLLPPIRQKIPALLTVHDLSFIRVPQAAHPALRAFLEHAVPRSIRRAAHLIADSQATKRDLIDVYGCAPQDISVVLSYVAPHFTPHGDSALLDQYGLRDIPYILCVGTVQPRKNFSQAVRALHRLGSRATDVHLVVAGGRGWLNDDLITTVERTQMRHRVHVLGFVNEAHLPVLYSHARMTFAASLYEGFGFPVLESMACGTPVITSAISSLPEVAGDAALLADPLSVDEIADSISRLLYDDTLHADLRRRGFVQAAAFNACQTASQLANAYQRVLQP